MRHRWGQFGQIAAREMAQTGKASTASFIAGYVVLLARFTIFPFIPAFLIALIYGSLFGGYWWDGRDTALMTFKFTQMGVPNRH